MFDRSISPEGACVSICNHRSRQAWIAYHKAREVHADAVDAWVNAGQHGEPPAEPEMPDVKFYPGDPLICGRDKAMTRRALLDLDILASQLSAASDGLRGAGPGDARVSGSKDRPGISPTAVLIDRMLGDLFDAEDEWRQHRGYAPRTMRHQRGSHPRSRTIWWLGERLDDLLAHPDMASFARTVLNWETILRKTAKDDPAGGKTPVRCTRKTCGERRVAWDEESRKFQCGACGNLINQKELDRQEHEEIEELSTPELAETA